MFFCSFDLQFWNLVGLLISKLWPNGLASRRNSTQICKPELPYGLALGSHKFTQVANSRTFHAFTVDLRSNCVVLGWVAKRWKPCVHSRIWARPKSTQVGRQTKRKLNASRLKTGVDLCRLASQFGQDFTHVEERSVMIKVFWLKIL